jgi:hypothetical protein
MLIWNFIQIHITMPMSPNGILLFGTWVPTPPIDILINLTNLMNYMKPSFVTFSWIKQLSWNGMHFTYYTKVNMITWLGFEIEYPYN